MDGGEWKPASSIIGVDAGESLRDRLARRFETPRPPATTQKAAEGRDVGADAPAPRRFETPRPPATTQKAAEGRDVGADAPAPAPADAPAPAPAAMVDQPREQSTMDADTLAMDERFSVANRLKSLLPNRGTSVRSGFRAGRRAAAAAPRAAAPVPAPEPAPAPAEPAIRAEPNRSAAEFAARLNANAGPAQNSGSTGPNACASCGRAVFMMEGIKIDSATGVQMLFHKGCLKCACCSKSLSAGNYAALDGKFYCKPHFKQLFTLRGNYNEGFGTAQRKHTHAGKSNAFCRPAAAAEAMSG